MKRDVVLVEDSQPLRESISELLIAQGYSTEAFESCEDLIVSGVTATVYLLDVNLPGMSGFEMASRIRSVRNESGIVFITARTAAKDATNGYELGGDLYITKPFNTDTLIAAISSLYRRLTDAMPHQAPDIILDMGALLMTGSKTTRMVTAGEASLINALAMAPDGVVEYWEMAELLNMPFNETLKSALEVRATRLRRKFSEAGVDSRVLVSVRNRGYRLTCSVRVKG